MYIVCYDHSEKKLNKYKLVIIINIIHKLNQNCSKNQFRSSHTLFLDRVS